MRAFFATIALIAVTVPAIAQPRADRFGDPLPTGAVRQRATDALRNLDFLAQGALREALQGDISAERRRRIDELLERLPLPPTGQTLRAVRAIRVLGELRGDDAKALLRELAAGASEHRVTIAARQVLSRSR